MGKVALAWSFQIQPGSCPLGWPISSPSASIRLLVSPAFGPQFPPGLHRGTINPPAQAPLPYSGSLDRIVPWPWLWDPTPEASPSTEPSVGCPNPPLGKRSGNRDREDLISPNRSCESSTGWAVGVTAACVTASGVQTRDRTLYSTSHSVLLR